MYNGLSSVPPSMNGSGDEHLERSRQHRIRCHRGQCTRAVHLPSAQRPTPVGGARCHPSPGTDRRGHHELPRVHGRELRARGAGVEFHDPTVRPMDRCIEHPLRRHLRVRCRCGRHPAHEPVAAGSRPAGHQRRPVATRPPRHAALRLRHFLRLGLGRHDLALLRSDVRRGGSAVHPSLAMDRTGGCGGHGERCVHPVVGRSAHQRRQLPVLVVRPQHLQ